MFTPGVLSYYYSGSTLSIVVSPEQDAEGVIYRRLFMNSEPFGDLPPDVAYLISAMQPDEPFELELTLTPGDAGYAIVCYFNEANEFIGASNQIHLIIFGTGFLMLGVG